MEPRYPWALRILRMVSELHNQGCQLLRIAPGLSASGCHWRCTMTPKSNILKSHGAMLADYRRLAIRYTSTQGNACFGWEDAQEDSEQELAKKFVAQLPEITAAARSWDPEYVTWYLQVLEHAERDLLPIAFADYPLDADPGYLPLLGAKSDLPMPPPGDCELRTEIQHDSRRP